MFFSKSAFAAVAMLGASMVDAHMKMSFPVPYSPDSLNNSPLAADGSDFPCKLRPNAFEAPAQENIFEVGSTQKLTFVGSATHGGGSCQISLTTDLQPSKSSEWMVIKSFEGGCPANVDGNMGGGPDAVDPYQFNFTIPEGISPGKYTLAWTWFNRIGNREMYMNCAPVTVTGGDGSSAKRSEHEFDTRSSNFPPLFVANVNGCITKEGIDIRFPDAGDYVDYLGNPQNLAPLGSPGCTGTPTFGGAGNNPGASGSSPSGAPGGGSSNPASPSAPAPIPATSAPAAASPSQHTASPPEAGSEQSGAPGVFAPAPSSSSEVPSAPAPTPAPEPTSAPAPSSPESGPSSSDAAGVLTGPCSTEGDWNCVGGSAFQRCASGQWTPPINLASGTQCAIGLAKDLKVEPSSTLKPRMLSAMRHHRKRIVHDSHHA